MRRLILATVATASLATAGLFTHRAEAMPLAAGLAGAATAQAESVALVCNRVWNGYAWVRSCYRTGPRYYAPRPYYGYGYYRPRPRFYGYY
ncbi:MAG TPA: hypothetical protein VF467_00525 [Afipia sp.]